MGSVAEWFSKCKLIHLLYSYRNDLIILNRASRLKLTNFGMELWNDYCIATWIVLLISTLFLFGLYVDRKIGYWKRRGVKSFNRWQFFLQVRDMFTKPIQDNIVDNYVKFGRIYGTYIGLKPHLSIADPELLKHILVKDFHAFRNRMEIKTGEPLFDKILGILQDDDWKRVRSVISPTFSSSRMRKMAYLVKECAEKFSENCKKIAEKGEEVDCRKYFSTFTIDVIASTAFGTNVNALENPNHPFVRNAKKLASQESLGLFIVIMMFPKLSKFFSVDTLGGGFLTYFKSVAMHIIEEREKKGIRGDDFLQLMLDANLGKLEQSEEDLKELKEEQHIQTLPAHKTISDDELFAQCIIFFIAGSETSSITLSFFSYYMALHPDLQERLIEEIDNTLESQQEINFDILSKMTYLDAVLCEVLRIQPVAVQLLRMASDDYTLGDTGIKIEKDVSIGVPIYAMHRDPEHFPDPEKFDPERFMPDNRQSIPPYVYLPFGEGPRHCIGMRFAIMVVKLCVIYLFKTVRLEATENTKKPLQFYKWQGGLQPKQVMIRMLKRSDVKT